MDKTVKPEISYDGYYPYCPACGYFDLDIDTDEKCPKCGQILDWSDFEK